MITLTRLNGHSFAVNPDLIERAEATPDTVVTLVDGTKLLVAEDLAALTRIVQEHRASVVARAIEMADGELAQVATVTDLGSRPRLTVTPEAD
ncbi:flagellar FlbD family protein [Demequina capsici]|uniref:Flagellar FlbD family protein n=1 Tax=Demequina capsici TaxID=3075620 RepID=A0AA96F775_9MICO|nr:MULTISPECIES: flagellar FlbD family protein [unclassified Demequina]WNM24559.1 flagellar FlbD family protein [Demequina sp. OYTSA14]WNM27410.1 flagellar FlbD family protein [Demequina sp. PMTSA13]